MFELVYPPEPAPLLPRRNAAWEAPVAAPSGEMLPVVEDNGLVVGQASRKSCHVLRLLHPVVHLHIIDRFGNIYLQKRSLTKDLYPGLWDFAVGGHVIYGELSTETLYREAEEEIGLIGFNPTFLESYVYDIDRQLELSCVFAAIGHFELNPDNPEVSCGKWWTVGEIEDSIGKKLFTPVFEKEFNRIKNKLLSLL